MLINSEDEIIIAKRIMYSVYRARHCCIQKFYFQHPNLIIYQKAI